MAAALYGYEAGDCARRDRARRAERRRKEATDEHFELITGMARRFSAALSGEPPEPPPVVH